MGKALKELKTKVLGLDYKVSSDENVYVKRDDVLRLIEESEEEFSGFPKVSDSLVAYREG